MARSLHRLENALRLWEDIMFFSNLGIRTQQAAGQPQEWPLEGAIRNFASFRKFVLGKSPLTLADFRGPTRFSPINLTFAPYVHFGEALYNWQRHSRRVYHVSKDLGLMLDRTSLKDLVWNDVHLPFSSYAIQLEEPLEWIVGKFDLLLVTSDPQDPNPRRRNLVVQALSTQIDTYVPVSDDEKRRAERLLSQRRIGPLRNMFMDFLRRKPARPAIVPTGLNRDESAEASISGRKMLDPDDFTETVGNNETREFDRRVARLALGLPLYMQSLPPKSGCLGTAHRQIPAGLDPKAIIREADICSIGSVYVLSEDERESLRRGGGTASSCHVVEGHFRRPPGLGGDSTAKRTVWVRPYKVRGDRLPPDSLHGGTDKFF